MSKKLWEKIHIYFQKIGSYVGNNGEIELQYNRKKFGPKNQKKEIIYILYSNNEIKYIGSTKNQIRPLSYHKNDVMSDVKMGIKSEINQNRKVDIYICEMERKKDFDLGINGNQKTYNFKEINFFRSVEIAWIKENDCENWNKQNKRNN